MGRRSWRDLLREARQLLGQGCCWLVSSHGWGGGAKREKPKAVGKDLRAGYGARKMTKGMFAE